MDQSMDGSKVASVGSPTELLQYIVKTPEGGHTCGICFNFVHQSRSNVRNHVESEHFKNAFVYTCPECNKECISHQALLKHKSRYHKTQVRAPQMITSQDITRPKLE